MPPQNPNFLQRIRDNSLTRIKQRIKQELAPDILPPEQGTDVPMKEKVAPGFWEKIKDKTREKLRDFSPIQRRLLDPRAPLDEPTIKYRIRYAGQSHLLLYMLYNDQWRHVEPYSYRYRGKPKNPQGKKELLFFGYCRPHDEIHAFKLEKIQGLIVTDEPFTPRWPIEVD